MHPAHVHRIRPSVHRCARLIGLSAAALLAACQCATTAAPRQAPITRAAAQAVLEAQAAQWNQGDLPGFVATYWDGPELTFLGAGGLTRGRADLLAGYQARYPDAAARGVLTFEVLEFQALGGDHALLLGKYHLERTEPASGFFSLVLARKDGAIVILHDHTSEASRPKG